MQKYGIIKDGDLLLSSRQLDGYKPVVFEQVPGKLRPGKSVHCTKRIGLTQRSHIRRN